MMPWGMVGAELPNEKVDRAWTWPIRNWKSGMNHFAILFEDRLPNDLC